MLMKKVIVLNRISIDGFFAGPNGEIDWFVRDPEVDKAVHEPTANEPAGTGTILLGRLTYQMFENFWPHVAKDPNAPKELLATAKELDELTKVVFSTTLKETTWQNSKLVKGDIAGEVQRLKQDNGPAMMIFGSGTIIQQLANQGLIDEYLLIVTPVILGAGKPLFKDVTRSNLELINSRSFASQNILLHYRIRT
jgi:dihydrofolate reductase